MLLIIMTINHENHSIHDADDNDFNDGHCGHENTLTMIVKVMNMIIFTVKLIMKIRLIRAMECHYEDGGWYRWYDNDHNKGYVLILMILKILITAM